AESERTLREEGIPVERLAPDDAARLFPSFDPTGLAFCLLETEAGVLRAKEATAVLAAQAHARGARFVGGRARPAGASAEVDGRGVKAASDREGGPIDPDTTARLPSSEEQRRVRRYLDRRFPALREAPLVGAHVCQYALTPDTNFLIAPHPEHEGVWIAGGGS